MTTLITIIIISVIAEGGKEDLERFSKRLNLPGLLLLLYVII